jgi:hypothetical protein
MICRRCLTIITFLSTSTIILNIQVKDKGKGNPVTGTGGPIGWVEVLLNSFLTSTLEGGVWSASHPGRLYPRERPGTHCIGGWVGPGAGMDRCGKSRPVGIRSLDLPARSESLYRLRYPGSKYTSTVCIGRFVWWLNEAALSRKQPAVDYWRHSTELKCSQVKNRNLKTGFFFEKSKY